MHREREQMVAQQIEARGIRDPRVLAALRTIPREPFVLPDDQPRAYEDRPLSIGEGQTISQPYIVALMSELADLEPGDRVLEIGTGSGYQTAVLAALAGPEQVYTIELVPALAARARDLLEALGDAAVHLRVGDGARGWPEAAPFDAIVVTAAAPEVPPALLEQLALRGRLVIPIGPAGLQQTLRVIERLSESAFDSRDVIPVAFVPLVPPPSV